MAIITPGPTVAAISGSIGGTVYSRNRGGAYIRNRAIPVDPNTSFQINVRAILAAQSQNWADLTDAQRAAFENWALQNLVTNALGNQIRLSGHQAFVQLNSRLALGGFATLTAPPILNAPLGLTSIALTADVGLGAVEVAFALTPLAAGISLWVLAAVVNSPSVSCAATSQTAAMAISRSGVIMCPSLLRLIWTSRRRLERPGRSSAPV